MDKLKQVLKYQFWILLGLAIIFPLVGWFLASSGMAKSFEDREKKLNGQLGQLKASAADPNGHWESELKKVNSVQELEMLKARVALWEMQQPLKVWPEKMSTTDPQKFTDPDKGYYRKNYNSFRQEIFEQLDPVVEEGEDGRRHGKVKMSLEAFPFSEAVGRQRATNPTNEEIEEAQEDLWLANALVQAVAYMNRDAVSQLDAVIPEITVFNLVGGNKSGTGPAKKAAKANSSSGDGGGTAAMGAQMADMAKSALKDSGFLNKSGTSGGGGAGGDVGTVGVIPSVTFDPVDEFGDPGEPARRYIDKSDDVRTRGFYLELKIEQTRVPELLVVLSSLDWPVRVSRVHVADVREEELLAADQAGGIGAGAGGSGASGMGGMGMMGGMGGGGNAMKAMSESMSKMGKQGGGGGGTGASASVGGALLGGGTKIAAGGTGGGANTAGGILGGGGLDDVSQALPKVDALANPNLVSLAIDGWFTIYVMPKQEVLDKVFPPASPGTQNETPATTSNAADNNASGNGTSTAGSVEDQSNSGAGAPASPAVEESVNETATPSEQTDSETGDEAATDTAKDGGEAKPESSGSASDPAKPASPNQ